MNQDALNWFEIPVHDIDRAQRFYEILLDISMERQQAADKARALFPYVRGQGVGGALVAGPQVPAPGAGGNVVYFDAGRSLATVLARAEELGARVLMPSTTLPNQLGQMAQVSDSEGNRIGLHERGAGDPRREAAADTAH